jgi:hypothetical protein
LAALLDQAARLMAGQVLRDPAFAARTLRIDRSILEILDPEISDQVLDPALENFGDRSIRAREQSCGNLDLPLVPPAHDLTSPGDDETERAHKLLNLYAELTGNRITAGDRRALARVFNLPDITIRVGILHAVCYSKRPIGSFAYCVSAINDFLDPDLDLPALEQGLIVKLKLKRKDCYRSRARETGEINYQEDYKAKA